MGCNVAQSNIFTLNAIRTEYDFYSSNIFTLNAIRTGVRTGRRPKVLAQLINELPCELLHGEVAVTVLSEIDVGPQQRGHALVAAVEALLHGSQKVVVRFAGPFITTSFTEVTFLLELH